MGICSYDFTTIDFPRKYSMVLYFAGCNLRCRFCYNKQVVLATGCYDFKEIVDKYTEQQDIFSLDVGVVFSGGEPTVSKDFDKVYEYFKDKPKAIHTNGLCLPDARYTFDSVILSVKSRNEGIGDIDKYVRTLMRALDYYDHCEYKELRVVEIEENMEDYHYVLDRLSSYNDTYKITFVEEVKVDG